MEKCECCGNAYEKIFYVVMNGEKHSFDSFECAIHKLAPTCQSCGMKIIGHGLEDGDAMFCCASCARLHGVTELNDHVGQENPISPLGV